MLKKVLALIFTLLSFCHGGELPWQDYWLKASQLCEGKEYAQAEIHFNETINEMEAVGDIDHPQIYLDRGRLYLLCGKNQEALVDFDNALSQELSDIEKQRALMGRIKAEGSLEMYEELLADIKEFSDAYIPELQFIGEKGCIRMPDCFMDAIHWFSVDSDICNSDYAIEYTQTGVRLVDTKSDSTDSQFNELR
jgi:tetratricopeptide (TPR) repeat protein